MTKERTLMEKARDAAGQRARRRAEVIMTRIQKAAAAGGGGPAESLEPLARELALLLSEEKARADEADLKASTVEKSLGLPEGAVVIMPDPANTTLTFHDLRPDEKQTLRKMFQRKIADSCDAFIYPDEFQRVSKSRMSSEWPSWGKVTAGIVGPSGEVQGITTNKGAMEKAARADFLGVIERAFRQPGNSASVVLR